MSGRVGKAVTATARKIAVLFYNTLRHGMDYADPGASYYEERYRQRVLTNLQRRRSHWATSSNRLMLPRLPTEFLRKVASLLGISLAAPDSDEEP